MNVITPNIITPYAYDPKAFIHYNIITEYLKKGLDYVTDDIKFRKKMTTQILKDMSIKEALTDEEYLYEIYDALGIVDPDVKDESTKSQLVLEYLYDLSFYPDLYVTKLEKSVHDSKSTTGKSMENPIKDLEDRESEILINEIACSIFALRNKIYLDNESLEVYLDRFIQEVWQSDDLFKEQEKGIRFDDFMKQLFNTNVVKLSIGADKFKNLLGVESFRNRYIEINGKVMSIEVPVLTYYTYGRTNGETKYKVYLKQKILERLCELGSSDNKSLLTSSSGNDIVCMEELIRNYGAGNLINCPKLCRSATKLLSDNNTTSEDLKKVARGICRRWMFIVNALRYSSRVSVYDYFSDVYFAGETESTTRYKIDGNLNENKNNKNADKTVSVTIATGTFKVMLKDLDNVISNSGLRIDPETNKLMAGNNGKKNIWNLLYGSTQPENNNWLDLSSSCR